MMYSLNFITLSGIMEVTRKFIQQYNEGNCRNLTISKKENDNIVSQTKV